MSELGRLKDADGLAADDRATVEQLVWELDGHARHNRLVRSYYDQEYTVYDEVFRLQLASGMLHNDWVTGWATKAVDALASRIRMDGFSAPPGAEPALLDAVCSANNVAAGYMRTLPSKLVSGCAFAVVNRGSDGHAHVRFHDAETASALEPADYLPGAVGAGLCVARMERTAWSRRRPVPTQANVYLPGRVAVLTRRDRTRWAAEVMPTAEPEPMMVALTHIGNGAQPFGHSRITRYVRQLCDEASRTLFRMQVMSTFYMMPRLALMGLSDEQFEAVTSSKMRTYVDSLIATTYGQDGGSPTLQQLNGASPQPFVEQLGMLARQFSFETSVPLASLGVVTSNPTSAEAIEAERGDICDVAERDIESDRESMRRLARLAMAVEGNVATSGLGQAELAVEPHFLPANMASLAARADAAQKYASVREGFGDTDACAEMMGFDRAQARAIKGEIRAARGADLIGGLMDGEHSE